MRIVLMALCLCTFAFFTQAQNPIIEHIFTADPAAMVSGDSVYIYTGHDEATPSDNFYKMNDWHMFSSGDMIHWKDQGELLSIQTFDWAIDNAWASHTIERNGKFYWYITASPKTGGGFAIGVAVADQPYGPFVDAIGVALITDDMTPDLVNDIDPAVFIDDDNQTYLYWGNGGVCKVVKLKENMIEMEGDILDITPSFFTEAAYMHKVGDTYYLSYAGNWPETIEYATSSSPLGPFVHQGRLNTLTSSTTNHQSIIEFKNQSYFIYHTGDLPTGGDYRRSVAIDYLFYNADGTIQEIVQTREGVAHVDSTKKCPPIPVEAKASINEADLIIQREIVVLAGSTVLLSPNTTVAGEWKWEGPANVTGTERELLLKDLTTEESGTYNVSFTNACGTKSYTSYQLKISFPIPDNITQNGTYTIKPLKSEKVITLKDGLTADGTNVILAPNEDKINQQFILSIASDVYWKMAPKSVPTKALDVFNFLQDDGANVNIWDYWGGAPQVWQIIEKQPDVYSFVASHSGKCLDFDPETNNVYQWTCGEKESQLFTLIEVQDNTALMITDKQNDTLDVYPVPANSDNLVIDISTIESPTELVIANINGQDIYRNSDIKERIIKPNMSLKPGIYFIYVNTMEMRYTKKIIVE
ncbi:MAG: family 43 glycosylhydrolase [Reichenbachiella sp.]